MIRIPNLDYNNFEEVYNYLQENSIIGNENLPEENNFHCFWKGPLLPLHLVSLKSIIVTQNNPNIIVWVPSKEEFLNSNYKYSIPKEVTIQEVTKDLFDQTKQASFLYSNFNNLLSSFTNDFNSYNHQVAYASDIFRFVVLELFGGIWFDLDVLFLKDMNNIKINKFVYKWGKQEYGNGAIMRLNKGNDIIEKVLNLKLGMPFYPTQTFDVKNNLDIWMLPTEAFDIVWKYKHYKGNIKLPLKDFNDFFIPTNEEIDLNFLPGCFTYHWHNRWNNLILKDSPIYQIYENFLT